MAMNQSEHYQLIDQVISLENDFSGLNCGMTNVVVSSENNNIGIITNDSITTGATITMAQPALSHHGVEIINDGSTMSHLSPMSQPMIQQQQQPQQRLNCVIQDCVDGYCSQLGPADSGGGDILDSMLAYEKDVSGDMLTGSLQTLEQEEEKVGIETIRKELVECDQTQQIIGQYQSTNSISPMANSAHQQTQYTMQQNMHAPPTRHLTHATNNSFQHVHHQQQAVHMSPIMTNHHLVQQQQYVGPMRTLHMDQLQATPAQSYQTNGGHLTYVPVSSAVTLTATQSAYAPQNVTWVTQQQQATNPNIPLAETNPSSANNWQQQQAPVPMQAATYATRTQVNHHQHQHHHHHQQALARHHYIQQQQQVVTDTSMHQRMQQAQLHHHQQHHVAPQATLQTQRAISQPVSPIAQTIVATSSTVPNNALVPTITTAANATKTTTATTTTPSRSIYIDENGAILDPQAVALSQTTRRQFSSIDNNGQSEYLEMRSSGSLSPEWLDKICRQLVEHMNHFGICVIDNFLGSLKADMILKEVQRLYSSGHYTKGRLVSNKFDHQQQTITTTTTTNSTTTTTTTTTNSTPPPQATHQITSAATTPAQRENNNSNNNCTNSAALNQQHQLDNVGAIRSDRVIWVDGCEEGCAEINNLIQTLCSVIINSSHLSLYSNNGLDKIVINKRTKAHVACYPGNGTRYIKHVDNPNGDGRVITAIYYLNKNWNTKRDGGLLRMFPAGMNEVANIEPLFDRVLFFWSDRRNPHEVLPAYRDRFAITVWYIGENKHIEHP